MQNLELVKEYETNGEIGKYILYTFGLSFLSPELVDDFISVCQFKKRHRNNILFNENQININLIFNF